MPHHQPHLPTHPRPAHLPGQRLPEPSGRGWMMGRTAVASNPAPADPVMFIAAAVRVATDSVMVSEQITTATASAVTTSPVLEVA